MQDNQNIEASIGVFSPDLLTAVLRTRDGLQGESKTLHLRPRKIKPLDMSDGARADWMDGSLPSNGELARATLLQDIHQLDMLNMELNMRGGFADEQGAHWRSFTRHLNADLVVLRQMTLKINVKQLEPALRGASTLRDRPGAFNSAVAEHIATLRLWKEALPRAHLTEKAKIIYTNDDGLLAVWTKAKEERWICVKHEQYEDEDFNETLYEALLANAKAVFDEPLPELPMRQLCLRPAPWLAS